ncbi:unnamed protein product [Rotaria sordida]|uniref:Apple domain-containing protein n=1 Tax=Rotaria sordida TaxID=392033 RepID=A0A814T835_9BILA|nr:unnamed protein product [Rotaria sordida]
MYRVSRWAVDTLKRSANIGDFLRKDEWDIPGNDISHSSIYASDYASCSVKCQETSGCKAFAYSPSTGQCWPKTSTGDGGKSNGDRISGYSSNMCGGFVRKDEWDIPGNDISHSSIYASDYANCCIKCQATSGCKAFAYSPSTGQCWPKTSTGDNGYSNSDRISGYNVNTLTYTHGIYTLAFVDEDNRMSATTRQGIIDTFFASYPQMCARFNPHSCARNVRMTIDPNYDGIAYVSSNGIVIGPWISNSPGGDDVVVHEAMHVVQSYPRYDPGWLTVLETVHDSVGSVFIQA